MRAAWLFILILTGCGDVRSSGNLGNPIWVMHGDLQGVALGRPEGEHRALFGWLSFGEGDLFDCLEQTSFLLCGLRTSYQYQLQLEDAEVLPVFPNGLDVPFYRLPREDELLSRDGAVMAVGGIGIYDDRNLNGELDPITSSDPIDRVVAESVTPPNVRSLAIYREGPIHPVWFPFRDAYGCPDPPLGFSVGRVDVDAEGKLACNVSRSTRLLVTASNDDQTARIRCGFGTGPLNAVVKSTDPMPLPDNAVVDCLGPNRMEFYLDQGSFCDQFDTSTYVLKGPQIEDPPAWWPCK